MKPNNIMTWYKYRHEYDCSEYLTIRKWNRNFGSQVKNHEVLDYLESFYGKIGEEPKEVHKAINHKVIVITKNGKIKQFRINALSTLNLIKIRNPFNNKLELANNDSEESSIIEFNFSKSKWNDYYTEHIKSLFPKKSRDVIAARSDFEEYSNTKAKVIFEKNPYISKDIKINYKFIRLIIRIFEQTDLEHSISIAKAFNRYKDQVAYYLADGKEHLVPYSLLTLFSKKLGD